MSDKIPSHGVTEHEVINPEINLKQEFVRFGETVSIKGVSRIFKAKSKVHLIFWLIAVLVSLGILLWQLTLVFQKYFAWPADTVIKEGKELNIFPDVTICNIYPTEYIKKMEEQISFLTYMKHVVNTTNILKTNCTENERYANGSLIDVIFELMKSILSGKNSYYSNFPIIDDWSNFRDTMITEFKLYDWHWNAGDADCDLETEIRLRWDADYYACSTISVPEKCRNRIRGLLLILYLDNFPKTPSLNYQSSITTSQATGAVVAIHPPGTEPDLKNDGMSFGPGTEKIVRLKSTIRSRLPEPYGHCTDQKYIQSASNYSGARMLYTKDLCFDTCFQQRYLDECGCLNGALKFTGEQRLRANGIVCGNLSVLEGWTQARGRKAVEDVLCLESSKLDFSMCEKECNNPCQETVYEGTVTTAPWPSIATHIGFYLEYINGRDFYNSKFQIYETLATKYNETALNGTQVIEQLEDIHLLEQNFLQVNIFFDSYYPLILKDVPSLTSDKLIGLIGGGLSLWLGITIMTFVEIVEFLYAIAGLYMPQRSA